MNHIPGPICGRSMNAGADHCGLPRLHRTRCESEQMPPMCEARGCDLPFPCDEHEGCFSLGFDRHQDVVTITTDDQFGREVKTKCRRCDARFGMSFVPTAMLAVAR